MTHPCIPKHLGCRLCAPILASVLCLQTGCTNTTPFKAYDDSGASSESIAVIRGMKRTYGKQGALWDSQVAIAKVDDRKTYAWWDKHKPIPPLRDIEVLPGKHVLSVTYQHRNQYASAVLWIIAEPGEEYCVKAEISGYTVRFWIEDKKGRVTGGIQGGGDESD